MFEPLPNICFIHPDEFQEINNSVRCAKKLKICENMKKDRYSDDYVKKMNDDIISNKIYINVIFGYNKYFK